MINIILKNDFPAVDEVLAQKRKRQQKHEEEIIPYVEKIVNAATKEISIRLLHLGTGHYDFLRSAAVSYNHFYLTDIDEIIEGLERTFQKMGYKTNVLSFSSGYKVYKRLVVKP